MIVSDEGLLMVLYSSVIASPSRKVDVFVRRYSQRGLVLVTGTSVTVLVQLMLFSSPGTDALKVVVPFTVTVREPLRASVPVKVPILVPS